MTDAWNLLDGATDGLWASGGGAMGLVFLQDMAVVMVVAAVTTILFNQLKQPVVLGYILAGFLVGPNLLKNGPHLVQSEETIETLGEMGVIFLLFALGLEFSLRKLRKVGATAAVAGGLEIPVMAFLGYLIGRWFGWSTMDAIFLGAMISISSTTIIVKVLGDFGRTHEKFAQIIFGILIIEDIVAIIMIALLSGLAATGSLDPVEVFGTLGRLCVFLAVVLVLGLILVPRLFNFIAKFKSDEMILVTALGLCLGTAVLATALEFSVALGAFLIGAVMAEARQIAKIEMLTGPVRDMFSAIFFVTIGMLIDPAMLVEHWLVIVVVSAAVLLGKVLACTFGAFVAGNGTATSLKVGLGLAQIGEFSFIIAALGRSAEVTSDFLYPVAVAVSVTTTLLAPYRIKKADAFAAWFTQKAPRVLVRNMELYTGWVGQFGQNRHHTLAGKLLWQWSAQLGINLLLTAAVFGVAAYFAYHPFFLPEFLRREFIVTGLFWVAAVLFSVPLYVASFRKMQAMGMLISEICVTREQAGGKTNALRAIVANFFMIFGVTGMVTVTLLLSATILPPGRSVLAIIILVTLLALLLRRHSIAVYAKAQTALIDIFKQPPAPRLHEIMHGTELLQEAELATAEITETCPWANMSLRELPLRNDTGASIVGIEREGVRTINPAADEKLLVGDKVLIIGARNQLEPAREMFGLDAKEISDGH